MVKQWQYGDAGDIYPVRVGDLWTVAGATFGCGDLERGAGEEMVERFGIPDMIYVDPPWGLGNARSWLTKAGLDRDLSWESFLKHLINVIRCCPGAVFIEMGKKWLNDLQSAVAESGGRMIKEWPVVYYGDKPSLLTLCAWGESPEGDLADFSGMDDDYTPELAINTYSVRGGLIFDPCSGRGLTSRMAVKTGRRFIGTELHPRRMAEAMRRLHKQGGGPKPEKIGELQSMTGRG